MDKIKEKINFKDKRVYIPLIIIGILLAILLLFGISNLVSKLSKSKENKFSSTAKEVEFIDNRLVDDPSRRNITVTAADENAKCVNGICVEDVKVMCYASRGIIDFTVRNNSSSTSSGYLNLTIGDYSAVIWYDSISPGKTYSGFHTYDGYDLSNADSSNYRVRDIDDDDKSSISTYKYYSCLTNRNYYELDYEKNRIFRSGDEDYKRTTCIKRSDANREITSVEHFYNPCKSSSEEPGVTVVGQCEYESSCAENSDGQCEFGGSGGDNENNNCVQYKVIETTIEYDEKGNEIEKKETKAYCGRKDSNGYINSEVGKLKCESYALCVDDGCYPFCEDLTANN